jgi:regulator of replication initiation timing
MSDLNSNDINDININLQFQNDELKKTLLNTRVHINSLDNEIEKLKLENKRLKEQIEKSDKIKEKSEPIEQNEIKPESSYFNIFSYFKK